MVPAQNWCELLAALRWKPTRPCGATAISGYIVLFTAIDGIAVLMIAISTGTSSWAVYGTSTGREVTANSVGISVAGGIPRAIGACSCRTWKLIH
jgi:hypothetical protein